MMHEQVPGLRRRIGFASGLIPTFTLLLVIVLTGYALAEEEDEGCFFDGRTYPEGYEMCQDSSLMRCEEGGWAPIGMCHPED